MKNSYKFYFISLVLVLSGCQQKMNQEIVSYEGEKILVGLIDLEGLSAEPYSFWFNENYQNYVVDESTLDGVDLQGVNIILFLGTWCSDSQLQVPQFYKILTYLNYDKKGLQMISLEKLENGDLISPQHEEEGLDIGFVPTMIFYRDGKELGRIIEFPKESLEADMARIVGG